MRTAFTLLASACLLAVGSSSQAREKLRNYEPVDVVLARVPQKARARRNPFVGDSLNDSQAPLAGRKLFDQHCAECHGETADGTHRGPGLRGALLEQATDGQIFWIITNGVVRRGMPPWSKLPEPQRWQIETYLKSFKTPLAKEPR